MMRFLRNLSEKEETGFWSSSPRTNLTFLFFLLLILLPTQIGLHFWPDFAFVSGVRVDYLSPTLYLTDIIAVLLIIFYLPSSLLLKKLLSNNKKLLLLLFLFVALNISLSSSPLSSLYYLLKILEMVFIFFFIIENFGKLKKFIAPSLSIGIIVESFLAALQFTRGGSINGIFYFLGERFFTSSTPNIANAEIGGELILRPYATFSHPNVLAAFILIGTFFILKELSFKRDFKNGFYIIALFSGFIGILLTLSRLPIVLYLILVFVFLFKEKLNRKRFITILFPVAAIAFLMRETVLYRFLNLFSFDETYTERINLLKGSFQMFYDNIFQGVGIGSFLHELPKYYTGERFFFLQPVHNVFLLVAAEAGIVGLLVLLFSFAFLFKKASVSNRLLLAIITILGLFDHYFFTIQQGQLLFTLVAAYIISDKKA